MTTIQPQGSVRQVYLDACRGLTMLLVIYSHIAYFIAGGTTELNRYFVLFRMPLFFFVSGFLAYSSSYDLDKLRRRSLNRLVRQLYPTVLIWALFCLIVEPHTDSGAFRWSTAPLDQNKQGYWFTLVAVELFALTAPLLYLMSSRRLKRPVVAVIFVVIGIGTVVYSILTKRPPRGTFGWTLWAVLSLNRVLDYAVYFVFGMLVKVFRDEFHSLVGNWLTFVVALSAFMLPAVFAGDMMLTRRGMIDYDKPVYIMCALSGIVMLYSLFYQLGRLSWSPVQRGLVRLSVIGRHTLEIYLLHYLLLFALRPYLRTTWLTDAIDSWYEFPLLFGLSTLIITAILGVVQALRRAKVYPIFFPAVG